MTTTGSSKRHRWWQEAAPDDFRERIAAMNTYAVRTVSAEIQAALSLIQGQLDASDPNEKPDWWRRTKMARAFIAEKRSFARAELARRDEQHEGKLRSEMTATVDRLIQSLDDARDVDDVRHITRATLVALRRYFGASEPDPDPAQP